MANTVQATTIEAQIQSSMPLPVMEYVEMYTDEAVRTGKAPNPPRPLTDSFQMFGQQCHQDDAIIRPLESQGLPRLYPDPYNKREELKKLTVSILCNFLDLLDILVKSGTSPGRDQKIEDLNLLFIHVHHLINEFRPHQARETLKVMMNLQKKNMAEACERLYKHMDKAAEIVKQCAEDPTLLNLSAESSFPEGDVKVEPMDIGNLLMSSPPVNPAAGDANGPGDPGRVSDDNDELLCGMVDGMHE